MGRILLFTFVHYKSLLLSLVFAIALVATRVVMTGSLFYTFLIWNLFLAVLPYLLTQTVFWYSYGRINTFFRFAFFVVWLVLLPNAPYIITDLIHLQSQYSFWKWLDLFIVFVFAFNGLLFGILSLNDVLGFLQYHFREKWALFIIFCICLLSGYGIYLGRFLRFNSWDILFRPQLLTEAILHSLMETRAWLMTLAFGLFFWMVFTMLRWVKEKNQVLY